PPFSQITSLYQTLVNRFVNVVANQVFHVSTDLAVKYHNDAGGSKDTTFAYVEVVCFLVIALSGAAIWSVLDRRRKRYPLLYRWFIVDLRLCLGAVMISYGCVKFFAAQFPPPTLSRLIEPYGDFSPMAALWTFMGTSWIYRIFAGFTEAIAGALLIVPGF